MSKNSRSLNPGHPPTRNEFLIRFYRWASEDTLGQLSQGFPRLKNLKSGPALKYLEFVDNLPQTDRPQFVVAKLKQSHDRASALLNESLSPVEKSLLDKFYRGHEVAMPSTRTRAYVSSRVEMALNDLKVSNPSAFGIDKSMLRAKVGDKLCPLLGKPGQQDSSKSVLFNTRSGHWSLITCVDTSQTFQLRYHHSIRIRGKSYLIERTSAFNWMGVKMETYWNYLTLRDLDSTAESIAEMCRVFLEALPKLLKGLDLPRGRS
jgi:hypothetical protein